MFLILGNTRKFLPIEYGNFSKVSQKVRSLLFLFFFLLNFLIYLFFFIFIYKIDVSRGFIFFIFIYKIDASSGYFSFFFFKLHNFESNEKFGKIARVHLTQSIFVVLQPLQNNRGDVEIVERLKSSTSRTVPLT